MIKLNRTYPPPESLQSGTVKEAKETIKEIARTQKPKSKEFDSKLWGKKDVRMALYEMHHGKCCYCERKRDEVYESDVEHFRPKAGVTEAGGNDGYWWLAYEWENFFFSCAKCNRAHKLNRFPIPNEEKRARTPKQSLEDENAYLIDPTKDDPEEHLSFDWFERENKDGQMEWFAFVTERGGSEKGRTTIDVAGLNRDGLPEERGGTVLQLESVAVLMTAKRTLMRDATGAAEVERLAKDIEASTSAKEPFTALRRDFFRKRGLGEFVAND